MNYEAAVVVWAMRQAGGVFSLHPNKSVHPRCPRSALTESRTVVLGTLHGEIRDLLLEEEQRPQ